MSQHAIDNAKCWLQSIREMVKAYADEDGHNAGSMERLENARTTILESPLEVMVRHGWHTPDAREEDTAAEYYILLSTGGPALRVYGYLAHGQPETATLEWQNWGTPWTPYRIEDREARVDLLNYASQFYFGE